LNLKYNQISRIQFDPCREFRIFRFVPSEKISIYTPKRGEPLIYTKLKEKAFFEQYKQELAKFAKDNRVTFTDNLNG